MSCTAPLKALCFLGNHYFGEPIHYTVNNVKFIRLECSQCNVIREEEFGVIIPKLTPMPFFNPLFDQIGSL